MAPVHLFLCQRLSWLYTDDTADSYSCDTGLAIYGNRHFGRLWFGIGFVESANSFVGFALYRIFASARFCSVRRTFSLDVDSVLRHSGGGLLDQRHIRPQIP